MTEVFIFLRAGFVLYFHFGLVSKYYFFQLQAHMICIKIRLTSQIDTGMYDAGLDSERNGRASG